ncbi:hypothetical protein [Pantoea anthophila]|uniref:hypothetical protein n=1 Tax=Pantoea anthophila TaxID=470931 RepID=UPI00278B2F92|nr:hypothetical protein [Pantoea anthophila]MDQ1214639.1 hypothetical protein [Pantoea anthophila]
MRCQLTGPEYVHLFPQPFIYLLQAFLQQHKLMLMKSRENFGASPEPAGVIPDNPHPLRWHAVRAERFIDSRRIISMLPGSLTLIPVPA